MAKKKVYDWKKTAEKALWSLLFILVSGFLTVYQDDPTYLVLVPLAEAAKNYLKHRK